MRRVHITNGEMFNQWLKSHVEEGCVPFNEAMMSHRVLEDALSESFVLHRAQQHHVSALAYRHQLRDFFVLLDHLNEVDELVLWFGEDAFCQMNLLTILHVLEKKEYKGNVLTVIFDENDVWEKALCQKRKPIHLCGYSALFKKVLVKREPALCDDEIMHRGIMLHLDYHSETGKLAELVKNRSEMDEYALTVLLIQESKEYGLSDVQAKELIQRIRN